AELDPGPVHGAVYYPRSAFAARFLGEVDGWLGRMTSIGAAFLAVAGVKEPDARDPHRPLTGEWT
ncbi:MAG: hypothetical protein ACODAA_03585, partial [Gemmatimonadota bacterium]